MLRWANKTPFFRCAHVRAIAILDRRPWLDACVQNFASPYASKSGRHDAITARLPTSKVSRNHGNGNVSELKVCRQSAHGASGDAKTPVLPEVCGQSLHNVNRQDVDVQFCDSDVRAVACSHLDAKSHSVDGDAMVFEPPVCVPPVKTHLSNDNVRGAECVASSNDDLVLATSSKLNDMCLPSDVSNASCESLHVSLQTLFEQTQNKAQKGSPDLQQKIDCLESEQFSLSDATILVKTRAFQSCSVDQLATVLQALKKSLSCPKAVHGILVRSSNVLLQPAELVQQKLRILYDMQLEEKVVNKLCGAGGVLSMSMESLQKRLMFYNHIGLTVEARNRMFSRSPTVLRLSTENRILPALNFLEGTGLTKEKILKVAEQCPELFRMSLDSNVAKKFEYFRQLGFSVDEFSRVFRCARRFSIKSIEEHLQCLKALGFDDHDVRSMIKKQPEIFACSYENLKRKMDFLMCEQNRHKAEIVHHPCCLLYSLQARMVPRFDVVNKLGRSKVYSLSSILDSSDSRFMRYFGK